MHIFESGTCTDIHIGYRVAQVRVVFSFTKKAAAAAMWPDKMDPHPPKHMAYIQWFTPFHERERTNGIYPVKRSIKDEVPEAEVIAVDDRLRGSVYLCLKFEPAVPRDWTSSNMLERADSFLLDGHLYPP